MKQVVCLLVVWLGVFVGCASEPGPARPPVDVAAAEGEFLDTVCRAAAACPLGSALRPIGPYFRDAEHCRAAVRRDDSLRDFLDLIARAREGTLRIDGAAARRCFDRIAASCSLGALVHRDCVLAFQGSIREGGACLRSEECASGLLCEASREQEGVPCPGRCRAAIALGDRCGTGVARECSALGATGTARCVLRPGETLPSCADVHDGPEAGAGEPCGATWTSPTTMTTGPCQPGLRCNSSRRCERVCGAASTGVSSWVCDTSPVRHAAGEPCGSSGALGMCNPLLRLQCVEGVCRAVGTGHEDTLCSTFPLAAAACSPGYDCRLNGSLGDPVRCVPVLPVGAPCENGVECESGSCYGAPRVCQARRCRAL